MTRTRIAAPAPPPSNEELIDAIERLTLGELMILNYRLLNTIQADCIDCRTKEETGLSHGYICPYHYEMIFGRPMPTLGEV
jgi:hypothetical protein